MAKSKSSKKSVSILLDFVTMVLGGLILGFIALPHLYSKVTVLGNTTTQNTSGFNLISFEDGADKGVATVLLLLTIFASLLILTALLRLLSDANVVKNKTFAKVVGFAMLFSALAVLALEIANCIMVPVYVSDASVNLGGLGGAGVFACWATLIINTALSLIAFVTSIFSVKR